MQMLKLIKLKLRIYQKQQMNNLKTISIIIVMLLGLLLFMFLDQIFIPKEFKFKYREIIIPENSSSQQIVGILKEKKIIKSAKFFKFYVKLLGRDKKLQTGSYILSPSFSLWKVVKILSGKENASLLIKITIPEGYKLTQIAKILAEKNLIEEKVFLDFANNRAKHYFRNKYKFLNLLPTNNIEGCLFPDTYFFYSSVTKPEKIFDSFLKQFNRKIFQQWQNEKCFTNLNFYQTLILASIVEKEAYLRDEMPTIAGVFYNRLKSGYRLASCVTVFYALGDTEKKQLSYRDLAIDSKYNTYKYMGLPPTPIASPGVLAFKASMQPLKTSFYYFVSKGDGSHDFSNSFQEHERKRRLYQKQ